MYIVDKSLLPAELAPSYSVCLSVFVNLSFGYKIYYIRR